MSDPAYPYGANPASAQDPYSQQTPYGPAASAPYGQPEAAYRQQPAYGMPNGMAYSQPTPAYAQPYYASSHLVAYADLRSQAHLDPRDGVVVHAAQEGEAPGCPAGHHVADEYRGGRHVHMRITPAARASCPSPRLFPQ